MSQLPLDFAVPPSYAAEDYIVTDANRLAHDLTLATHGWNSHALLLAGPPSSGKTHLAHVWAARTGAAFIAPGDIGTMDSPRLFKGADAAAVDALDDVQSDQGLYHLLNYAREEGKKLLLTATDAAITHITLKDARSRLLALPVAALPAPDDALLKAMLLKQLSDRQLRVADEVAEYIAARMERSCAMVQKLVRMLDALALAERKNITVPLARKVLEALEA